MMKGAFALAANTWNKVLRHSSLHGFNLGVMNVHRRLNPLVFGHKV